MKKFDIRESLGSAFDKITLNGNPVFLCAFDGGSRPNPGETYSAFRIECKDFEVNASYYVGEGTNNLGELQALINLCTYLYDDYHYKLGSTNLIIVGDSSYVINSINKGWYKNWINNGETYRPNYDKWRLLDAFSNLLSYAQLIHVPGHSGIPINETVDELTWLLHNTIYRAKVEKLWDKGSTTELRLR